MTTARRTGVVRSAERQTRGAAIVPGTRNSKVNNTLKVTVAACVINMTTRTSDRINSKGTGNRYVLGVAAGSRIGSAVTHHTTSVRVAPNTRTGIRNTRRIVAYVRACIGCIVPGARRYPRTGRIYRRLICNRGTHSCQYSTIVTTAAVRDVGRVASTGYRMTVSATKRPPVARVKVTVMTQFADRLRVSRVGSI